MKYIYSGSTKDCLMHLKHSIENDRKKLKVIASFTKVTEGRAVSRWLKGTQAGGMSLVRLRYYLEFLGYNVEELQHMHPTLRDAGRLFAFGVADLNEIVRFVGYSDGQNGNDSLLLVFKGLGGVSAGKLVQFQAFVDLYKDKLLEKQQATVKVEFLADHSSAKVVCDTPDTTMLPTATTLRSESQSSTDIHEVVTRSLAAQIKAMLPLVQIVSSDAFSPEERAQLRELTGGDGVFRLANQLYRLCGERARSMRTDK